MISISSFSALLFSIGLVSAVACSLHIAIHVSLSQTKDRKGSFFGTTALRDWKTVPGTSVNPFAVEQYAFVVSTITLVLMVAFGMLDLTGAVVLRSRMWRKRSYREAYKNNSSGDKDSGGGGGYHDDWRDYHPNDTTVYRYGVASQHHHRPLVWWRRWASIEGLVFGIRRNMGFIRLSAALLLSLIWSPAIVQIAIVGYTGQCHIAVSSKNGSAASSRNGDSGGGRGGGGGDNAGGTAADVVALDACDLVRKALVTSIFAWVSSSLMAVLLVLVNTTGSMGLQAKDLMPYHIVPTDPTPLAGGGVIVPNGLETANVANGVNSGGASGLFGGAGIYQRTSGLFSSKLNSNSGTGLQMTGHMPFNQGLFHPHYLIHHPHGSTAASTTGPKDPNIAQYRASWSHTDGESIVSELSRLEGQGITKAHIGQHQQPNTLHQSYHMKSQSQLHPLHGINQFHPPSRISEEEQHQTDRRGVVDQHSNLSRNLAFAYGSTQRRARAAFYKTRYSTSILGMADPLAHMGGGSEAKMLRDGAGGAQRQHYQMQQYLNHGRPPLPGIVASRSGGVVARSLARPSYESCDGVLATASLGGADSFGIDTGSGGGGNDGDGDSKIKRNTIG